MTINWFTFAAQIVNFFVLVWILRYVLYQPILEALEARRQLVEKAVADAAAGRETAERDRQALAEERQAYGQKRQDLERQLREEMAGERLRLQEAARQEIETMSAGWKKQIAAEQAGAGRLLAGLAGQELVGVLRRTMQDLSGTELDQAIAGTFLRRLRTASPEDRARLRDAMIESGGRITVQTATSLSEGRQAEIRREVLALVPAEPAPVVEFAEAAPLIAGLEIIAGDRRISWSFAEHLDRLQERMEQLLQEPLA